MTIETIQTQTATTTPAAVLAEQFTGQGFESGIPRGLSPRAFAQDCRSYGRMRCSVCLRKGMSVQSWRRKDRKRGYRLLVCCLTCGHASEA